MESVFVSFLGLSQTPAPNPCIISLYSSSPQIKPKKSQFSGLKWPFQPFLETPRIWPWMALTQQFLEQNHWMLKKPNNETRKNKKPPEEPIDISLPPNVTAEMVAFLSCWAQDYIENKKMSGFIWMGRLRLGMNFPNTFCVKNTINTLNIWAA